MEVLTFIMLFVACETLASKSDIGLTPTEMIQNHGYPSETHQITTEDGYILTYHRIPSTKPPILLFHGLFSSSAEFVNVGTQSLAFFLSNSGYDVWIANARGNAFSRNHTFLDPVRDQKYFFNFSWHEIGYYDLPAAVDYILKLRNEDSLYYVGHSQGTTTFLVMGSTRPEYNKKIKIAHLLAPAAILTHSPSKKFLAEHQIVDLLAKIESQLNIFEVPFTDVVRQIGTRLCSNVETAVSCQFLWNMGTNFENMDMCLIPVFLTNFPSNCAINQLLHFLQLMRSGKFQQRDYGRNNNLELYGTEVPPAYDMNKIKIPVALYYGASDRLVAAEDVLDLITQLPNVVLDYLVPRKSFNHFDFLLAKDAVTLVYNRLLQINRKY